MLTQYYRQRDHAINLKKHDSAVAIKNLTPPRPTTRQAHMDQLHAKTAYAVLLMNTYCDAVIAFEEESIQIATPKIEKIELH